MANRKRTDWALHENRRLIRERVLEIGDGYRAKNSELGDDGLPFARAGNVNGDFNFIDADILDSKSVAKAKEKVSRPEDSVITTKGTFGRVAFVRADTPTFVYSPQLCYWRVLNPATIEPRFLYYWLQGPEFYSQAFQIKSSTDMADYASLRDQREMKISLPTLATQRKIAAILSAYDELIENNKRRIALLEKMAEEIYREWFVRLRFPGHEKVKLVKGTPSGWSSVASNKAFKIMSGGTPSTENPSYWDGGIPFFTPRDGGDNFYVLKTDRTLTQNGLESCSSQLFVKNTIFITARGTVGKVYLNFKEMAMNQTCYALAPIDGGDAFFHFLTIKNAITYIKGISKSGVFDNIIVDTFKIVPVLLPPADLVLDFNRFVSPIFAQIGTLLESNEVLKRTRDLLLPRLISDKLSVENLDIQFPPGMMEEYENPPMSPLHKKGGSGGSEAED